jgi:hypothetical protein
MATLSTRNEALRDTIAFPVPTSLFRASEPTIDLHIFASRSFNVEATFENRSSLRAIEFSDPPGSRDGLRDIVDQEANRASLRLSMSRSYPRKRAIFQARPFAVTGGKPII